MKAFQYSTGIIILFLFLVISCKKDTAEHVQPEKGKWLLNKVYMTLVGGYNPPPTYLGQEYIYNDQKRPWLDISYNSSHDTTRMDTLFYDDQNRLSQMGIVVYGYKRRSGFRVQKIHYAADGKIDTIKIFNPAITNPLLNIITYKYEGSIVTEYVYSGAVNTPFVDSFRYTYNNGNLVEWRTFPDPAYGKVSPEVYTYSQYDDCYNILSYLNMNVYLPSSDCSCYYKREFYNEPLLSDNNYLLSQITETSNLQFEGLDFPRAYTYEYTKDSTGLIIAKTIRSPSGIGATKYSYEYIPAN